MDKAMKIRSCNKPELSYKTSLHSAYPMQRLFCILKIMSSLFSSPSSPPPLHPEVYAVYFYAFPSEFPDFPEIESSAR